MTRSRHSMTATTEKPAVKKAPKAAVPAGECDRFGSCIGSKFAAANAVLTHTPKKMKQIVEEAKLPDTVYNHLNALVKAGTVEKTDAGYKLPGEPEAATPAKPKKSKKSKKVEAPAAE